MNKKVFYFSYENIVLIVILFLIFNFSSYFILILKKLFSMFILFPGFNFNLYSNLIFKSGFYYYSIPQNKFQFLLIQVQS